MEVYMAKANAKKYGAPKKSTAASGAGAKKESRSTYPWELLAHCILILFFIITNEWGQKYETQLLFAIGTGIIWVISMLSEKNRSLLFEKISFLFLILLAQCVLYFIGLFYAWYPKFALQQFFLNIGGFFVFSSAYVCFKRDGRNLSRFALFLSACIALVSLISIELATSRHLLGIFEGIAKLLSSSLPDNYSVFETNTRVITVLGNPNVYAPIALFGMFLSLWHCGTRGDRSGTSFLFTFFALICAAIFVLCFSMGTILVYIAALFGLLIFVKKEMRAKLVLKNIVCLIAALLEAFAVFALRNKSVLPVLSVIILSALFAGLYTYLKPLKLPVIKLGVKIKKAPVIIAVAAAILLFAVAYVAKGPVSLAKGGSFRRAVALDEGTYTLEALLDGAGEDASVSVSITSMSYAQAALKENTALKSGVLRSGQAVEFTVPKDSAAVFFSFRANAPVKITEAIISGEGTSKKLALHYIFIPEFIVNRLQGLWVNDNAIQRFIFFRDGIRLGMDSPIIGQGGGAFEGGLFGAADYHYVTRHPHNEYIQRFIDGGLIGLLLFLALTVFVFRGVFRLRNSDEEDNIYPLLLGCMLVVFLHALLEVDFMMPSYRLLVSILFALVAARGAENIKLPKKLNYAAVPAFVLLAIFAAALAIGRFSAIDMVSKSPTLKTLEKAAIIDPFNSEDYKISYLISTMDGTNSSLVTSRQSKYLASLEKGRLSTDSLYYLAQFHLLKQEPDIEKGVEAAEEYIRKKRVDAESWDKVFALYSSALNKMRMESPESKEIITASVGSLCSYLQELNVSLPKAIEPSFASFVSMKAQMLESNSMILADSRKMYDLNMDGVSDLVDSISGQSARWKLTMLLSDTEVYVIRIYQNEDAPCRVFQDRTQLGCEYNQETGCFETFVFDPSQLQATYTVETDNYSEDVYFTIEKLF
jgi:hypothetical protein